MYLTHNLDLTVLDSIEISNQDEIKDESDYPLDLKLTWNEIKRKSDNFQIEDESLAEVDQLLAELLEKKGIELSPPEDELELIEIEEEERKRRIKLAKIKLKLNLK